MPSTSSSASCAWRMTSAPSRSSALEPAQRGAVTGPGTAPTARPSSCASSAVISEPERSAASTTIVSDARPGDRAVARGKAPAKRPEARRHLGDRACAAHERAVQAALAGGIGDVGAAGEHGDRRAADLERARVRGGVDAQRHAADDRDAGGRQPAAEAARHLEAVGAGAARADDRDGRRVVRPRAPSSTPRIAGDVQDRRRVVGLEQARRIALVVAADRRASPRPSHALARRAASKAPCASSSRAALAGERGDQLVVAQREQLARSGGARAGRARCAARARATSALRRRQSSHALMRATAPSRTSCWRSASASATCASRDARAALEVGDRARDAQDAPVAAGAERALLVGAPQRARAPRVGAHERRAAAAGSARRSSARRCRRAGAPGARGRRDVLAHLVASVVAGVALELLGRGRCRSTSRSMRSSSGPLSLRRWRAMSPSEQRQRALAGEPARARVRRRDELKARREVDRALAAHDRHDAVLQRLAQRLERRAAELRQLVEEQHAVVGEAHLAGLRQRAAADEARRRDRVVRRAERSPAQELAADVLAGDAVDPRDGDRLVAA